MAASKLDLMKGTLDLMVLQTLAAMGSMHGYGIARRIEQVSGDKVLLNQGTIYAALVRLAETGLDRGRVGHLREQSQGQILRITRTGRRRLAEDAAYWSRLSGVMGRVLAMRDEGGER